MTRESRLQAVQETNEDINRPHDEEFLKDIDTVNQYCLDRGATGGLDTGFPMFTECIDGLQPGLIFVAGRPNAGKSAFCMQMAIQVAQRNPNVFCVYHSIDDNMRETIPRAIAHLGRLPINAVKFPERYGAIDPRYLTRRAEGLRRLRSLVGKFAIRDMSYNGDGSELKSIVHSVESLHTHLPKDTQIVLFVDNFHDITLSETPKSDSGYFEHIAKELTDLATRYDLPVICPAEMRKVGGFHRPNTEHLRETVKSAYTAKAIILCHNEVGLKGEDSRIYHMREDSDRKQPVLEVHFGKNKLSGFKGRIFYHFFPEISTVDEATEEANRDYLTRIR